MKVLHESEYIRSCEKHVIEENKKYWAGSLNVSDGTDWIYVFHSVAEDFESIVRDDIFAKGLQEKKNLPIVSVFCTNRQPSGDKIDSSFGIQHIIHLVPEKFVNIISRIRTYTWAKFLSISTYGKVKKLFQIKYRGILCGDAISDTIIRERSLDAENNCNFDYFSIRRSHYCEYIRDALSVIDHAYAMFKRKRPAYVITAECVYSQSLFMNVANAVGATVFITPFLQPDVICEVSPQQELLKVSEQVGRIVESLVGKRLVQLGDVWQDNVDTLLQEKDTQDDIRSYLGINNDKKNIFIMLHAFADAPRAVSKLNFYYNYNDWFLDTMRIIKDIKNVNWIIKNHPLSTFYGQDNYVKKVYEQIKSENIFWCDKSINRGQIKKIADCIVTCAGSAGIEYWSYGIPTITLSNIYYSKVGISYNIKTLKEYENVLQHIEEIAKPSAESILEAQKRLMILQKIGVDNMDELTTIFSDICSERVKCVVDGNKGETPLYHFCKRYLLFMKCNDIKKSSIYQFCNVIK